MAGLPLLPDEHGDTGDCEEMFSVAWDAYRAVTGADLPDEAEMRRRLPRLSALYLP